MSFPYKTILCPLDFDENSLVALDRAVELARHFDSRLILLHVLPLVISLGEVAPLAGMYEDQEKAARAKLADPEMQATGALRDILQKMKSEPRLKEPLTSRTYNVGGKRVSGADLVPTGKTGASGLPDYTYTAREQLGHMIDEMKAEPVKPGRSIASAAEANDAPGKLAAERAQRTRTPTPEEAKSDSIGRDIGQFSKDVAADIGKTREGTRTAAGAEMNEGKVKSAVERARRTSSTSYKTHLDNVEPRSTEAEAAVANMTDADLLKKADELGVKYDKGQMKVREPMREGGSPHRTGRALMVRHIVNAMSDEEVENLERTKE